MRLLSALAIFVAVLVSALPASAQHSFTAPRIILYSEPDFGGRAITITRAEPDLGRWSFNDRAQSVYARGRWLLCRGRFYQQKCVTVSGKIRSLRPYGMNRRAGSVKLRQWPRS